MKINFISLKEGMRIIHKYTDAIDECPTIGLDIDWDHFDIKWEDWELDNFVFKEDDKWISLYNLTGEAFVSDWNSLDEAVADLLTYEECKELGLGDIKSKVLYDKFDIDD